MIRQIQKKLRSQCGATILMAMLFLLLCTMVGAVVLTSASANTNKTAGRAQMQAEYLALSSAIRFIEDTVDGKTCEGIEQMIYYYCGDLDISVGAPHPDRHEWKQDMTMEDREDDQLQAYIEKVADGFLKQSPKYISSGGGVSSKTTEFTIQGQGMEPVKVSMTMNTQYNLHFVLTVEDSSYQAILDFKASVADGGRESEVSGQDPHRVWRETDSGRRIEVDADPGTITKMYTTKVTWIKNTLTKGNVE